MIKYTGVRDEGGTLIGLGISEGNVERLRQGMPIFVKGEDLGVPGISVLLHYGDTEESIVAELQAVGFLPPDVP